jgi:hypothetical protein
MSAWLSAVPKAQSENPLSRLEALRKRHGDNYSPDMPPLEAGEYLVNYLFEIGPVMAAGMGAGPITNQELSAWQRNTGIELRSWEARFICRLSSEYLGESRRAQAANAPAPWESKVTTEERREVAFDLRDSLRSLARK